MTTDPEEGRRQIEAMKPEPLKVGDLVRLKAGRAIMKVVGLHDYSNMVECGWITAAEGAGDEGEVSHREAFHVISLVRIEAL